MIRRARISTAIGMGLFLWLTSLLLGPCPRLSIASEAEPITVPIERYRMGETIVKVINEAGQPISGAGVRYTQLDHDFLFGVGMTRPTPPHRHPLSLYRKLREAGINYALPWLSWGHLEPQPGRYDWGFADYLFMPEQLNGLGYTLNAHCFIWFYERYGNLPRYLRTLSFSELLEAIYRHTYEVSSHYKDAISQWEVAEPIMQNALNLTLEQWLEVIRTVKRAVEEADSHDQVMINLWPTPIPERGYDPHVLLGSLFRHGVEFDLIGVELYPIGVPKDRNGYPDLDWTSRMLDSFWIYGKPVILSETTVPNRPSEATKARWLRDLYILAFGKPFIKGIVWYFLTDDPFLPGGGLFEEDYTPRDSYRALEELLRSWTTEGSGRTDIRGEFRFRGFAGEYELEISASGYEPKRIRFHIAEREESSITVALKKD